MGNLVSVAGELHQLGVDLVVLDQAIDTGSPAGRMLFHVLAAIAEFEHDLIAERTRDWLAAARARRGGKLPPRGPSISSPRLAGSTTAATCPPGGSPQPSGYPGPACTGRCGPGPRDVG